MNFKKYHVSPNIFPPPTQAASGEVNGVTYSVSADGVCTFSGTANATTTIWIVLTQSFVIPYSAPAGGQGTVAFNNTKIINGTVQFYNGTAQVDAWQLNAINRTHTSYSGMAGKTVTRYAIQIVNGENADGLSVAVAFSDNGVPVSPFEPYDPEVWHNIPCYIYGTETDAFTSYPVQLYTDGQPVSSYTLKGNTSVSGTPSPQNPVTIQGVGEETANLLNWSYFENGYFLDNTTGLPEPYTFSPSRIATTSPIDVSANNNVTFSFTTAVTTPLFIYSLFNGNTLIRRVANNANGATIDVSEGDKLYLCIYSNINNVTTSYINEAMLNDGTTSIPFEPYGFKISILKDLQALTPVYLSEPLMKIGDIEDTLNSDGTVTRRIGKIDLGTLNWHLSASYNGICDSTVPNMRIINNTALGNAICTSFVEVNANSVTSTSYGFSSCLNSQAKPYINHTGFEGYTDEQFKEALSGVIMYYVLATPTTETVTAPTITTTGGTVTLDVDTTVKPSELDLTYHGWHEHEPLKRENGQWV